MDINGDGCRLDCVITEYGTVYVQIGRIGVVERMKEREIYGREERSRE